MRVQASVFVLDQGGASRILTNFQCGRDLRNGSRMLKARHYSSLRQERRDEPPVGVDA